MSSINYLNCKFFKSKLYKKNKLMDLIVNNILLTQNLRYVLKAYKTCNQTVRFLKYVIILNFLKEVIIKFVAKFCHF